VPEPLAGPGQVIVKVAGSGLCHTDFIVKSLVTERTGRTMRRPGGSISPQRREAGYDDFEHGRPVGRAVLIPAVEAQAAAGATTDSSRMAAVPAGV
jgi:hypothetical protein